MASKTELRKKILNQAKKILSECLDGIDAKVFLFGSWAREEERQSSDLDIALLGKGQISSGLLSKIRTAFEESTIPYKTDIVDLAVVNIEFKNKVMKEGIEWNVCDKD